MKRRPISIADATSKAKRILAKRNAVNVFVSFAEQPPVDGETHTIEWQTIEHDSVYGDVYVCHQRDVRWTQA